MFETATVNERATAAGPQPQPASVLALDLAARRVQVQPTAGASDSRHWCRMAAPGLDLLQPGDEVLVTGTPEQGAYVIGVLSAHDDEPVLAARELRLAGGARAVAEDDTRLRLHAGDGRLLFEYDAASGHARLHAPAGGLEIAGGTGDLALTTDGDLRLAAQTVHVNGRVGVRLGVADSLGRVASGLRLGHRGAHLFGATLEVLAGQAKLMLREVLYRGDRVDATLERMKFLTEHLEASFETVITRARNVYQSVRELSQLRTGRLRTVVEEGAHLQAGKLDLRAKADVSIDGERIHLG